MSASGRDAAGSPAAAQEDHSANRRKWSAERGIGRDVGDALNRGAKPCYARRGPACIPILPFETNPTSSVRLTYKYGKQLTR